MQFSDLEFSLSLALAPSKDGSGWCAQYNSKLSIELQYIWLYDKNCACAATLCSLSKIWSFDKYIWKLRKNGEFSMKDAISGLDQSCAFQASVLLWCIFSLWLKARIQKNRNQWLKTGPPFDLETRTPWHLQLHSGLGNCFWGNAWCGLSHAYLVSGLKRKVARRSSLDRLIEKLCRHFFLSKSIRF